MNNLMLEKDPEIHAFIRKCNRVFLKQQSARSATNALEYIHALPVSEDDKKAFLDEYRNVIEKEFTKLYKKDTNHSQRVWHNLNMAKQKTRKIIKKEYPTIYQKLNTHVYRNRPLVRYTPKTDIWALGALLLCLRDSPITLLSLTGDNIRSTINGIKTLSTDEKDFLHKTLRMNPSQRVDLDTLALSSYLQLVPPRSAHASLGTKIDTLLSNRMVYF